MATKVPQIAILGAGIFVKTVYIPKLAEISHLFHLKAIWSRSQGSATAAVEIAGEHFAGVECKWGDSGLEEIIQDGSIDAVAIVLAGQNQVDFSLRLLKAGKHVIQEKPASSSTIELETALSSYQSISAASPGPLIWSVAENYRFESGLLEGKKLIADIGKIITIHLTMEASMTTSNPYYSTSWRHSFTGGYVLDMGVHFVAALRLIVGSEVASVSARTSHVDLNLPPPDTISSVFQLENGCSGVFAVVVNSKTPKFLWRFVGLNGTLEIEQIFEGKQGYLVSLHGADGQVKRSTFPSDGVIEELKAFLSDVSENTLKKGSEFVAEPRLSIVEGARDVAVLEAIFESGAKEGEVVHVKKF
ncbi:uncharacterized protein LOC114183195 [Vigna unguiculata]|uniref:uncharacterized protein LOC114183195 n=1 Tax=Vigna unguiculata TaxID=3917 RepID=UPI001016B3E2|nr:uncharacterized protein LOC114183195 [Vigna unguiculata]